jgi:hypothetical protein
MNARFLGSSAGLLLALVALGRGQAQSADPPSLAATTATATTDYEAANDTAAVSAADMLGLNDAQRQSFYDNVNALAQQALIRNPSSGRLSIDSALGLVVRETGRKLRFLRQARLLFSDMYARRSNDRDRVAASEDQLWRSPRNVSGLIELYRKNPNASDADLERAMAPAFRGPP